MAVTIDVILVGIIVLFALIGAARGFIKEIVSLIGFVIAFLLAFYLSGVCATFIFNAFFEKNIQSDLTGFFTASNDFSESGIIGAMPEYLVKAAGALGVNIGQTVETGMGTAGNAASSVAAVITQKIARPFVTGIVKLILFLILFIVLKLLIRLAGKALNIFSKLPVIHTANKLLGFIVGAAKGLIFALVCCYAVVIISTVRQAGVFGITAATIESSHIFHWFANLLI